jgi:hypothetical protein
MSGPFTWDELKKEARGNVIVSPLGAVDKAGEPGKLRIIRDLSFKGRAPFSVNDKIDKNAFTTKWGTAASVIDLVCSNLVYSSATMAPFVFVTSCTGERSDIPLLSLQRVRVQLVSYPVDVASLTVKSDG